VTSDNINHPHPDRLILPLYHIPTYRFPLEYAKRLLGILDIDTRASRCAPLKDQEILIA